jgi:hypothetical protein
MSRQLSASVTQVRRLFEASDVLAGLVPAIHAVTLRSDVEGFLRRRRLDGRDKPDQDALSMFREVAFTEPPYKRAEAAERLRRLGPPRSAP